MSDQETQPKNVEEKIEAQVEGKQEKGEKDGKKFDKGNRKGKGGKDGKDDKPRGGGRKALYEKWEKEIEVTLETKLPELPAEKLTEPNNDDLRQKLKDLDKEINQKRDSIVKLKAKRSEAIQEERKARDEKQGNLKGLFNQTRDLNLEITDLNDEKKL